jgi:hypothetical protein
MDEGLTHAPEISSNDLNNFQTWTVSLGGSVAEALWERSNGLDWTPMAKPRRPIFRGEVQGEGGKAIRGHWGVGNTESLGFSATDLLNLRQDSDGSVGDRNRGVEAGVVRLEQSGLEWESLEEVEGMVSRVPVELGALHGAGPNIEKRGGKGGGVSICLK